MVVSSSAVSRRINDETDDFNAFCIGAINLVNVSIIYGYCIQLFYSDARGIYMLRLILILILFPCLALSQDFRSNSPSKTGVVKSIPNPLTLVLADGRIVTLSGLHFPDYKINDIGNNSEKALDLLRGELKNKRINIYGKEKNRMGHIIAQVTIGDTWVQGMLLSKGLAQVRITQNIENYAPDMLALETKQGGVWEDYPILDANSITDANFYAYRIIEGKVRSISTKGDKVYINFADDWRSDTTICIPSKNAKLAFAKAGIDLTQLGGKTVRARGWLREYNGAYMEIEQPQSLEIIGE